jgi:hypothetical protein
VVIQALTVNEQGEPFQLTNNTKKFQDAFFIERAA